MDRRTYEEIEVRCESEWVLIGSLETDEALNIRRGAVPHRSKDRDEVYDRALRLRPSRSAVIYAGALPEGTAIVL